VNAAIYNHTHLTYLRREQATNQIKVQLIFIFCFSRLDIDIDIQRNIFNPMLLDSKKIKYFIWFSV